MGDRLGIPGAVSFFSLLFLLLADCCQSEILDNLEKHQGEQRRKPSWAAGHRPRHFSYLNWHSDFQAVKLIFEHCKWDSHQTGSILTSLPRMVQIHLQEQFQVNICLSFGVTHFSYLNWHSAENWFLALESDFWALQKGTATKLAQCSPAFLEWPSMTSESCFKSLPVLVSELHTFDT